MIQNNKLIAEFLEWKYFPFNPGNEMLGWYNDKNGYICRGHRDLRFDSEWNWLMLAVEKIESIQNNAYGKFNVYIYDNVCSIESQYLYKHIRGDLPENQYAYMSNCNAIFPTKLQSTYYNVVEFIKFFKK